VPIDAGSIVLCSAVLSLWSSFLSAAFADLSSFLSPALAILSAGFSSLAILAASTTISGSMPRAWIERPEGVY